MSRLLRLYINKIPYTQPTNEFEDDINTIEPEYDRAVKSDNELTLYNGNTSVVTMSGDSHCPIDWNAIKLVYRDDESPAEFTLTEPTGTDRLQALESALLEMMMGGTQNV